EVQRVRTDLVHVASRRGEDGLRAALVHCLAQAVRHMVPADVGLQTAALAAAAKPLAGAHLHVTDLPGQATGALVECSAEDQPCANATAEEDHQHVVDTLS